MECLSCGMSTTRPPITTSLTGIRYDLLFLPLLLPTILHSLFSTHQCHNSVLSSYHDYMQAALYDNQLPVIVLGNKCDENEDTREVDAKRGERFVKKRGLGTFSQLFFPLSGCLPLILLEHSLQSMINVIL